MLNPQKKEPTVIHDARRNGMASPQHLKDWLRKTRRHFVVLKSDDLVDSLPWPDGVESIIEIIECYRQHRAVKTVDDFDENGAPYKRAMDDRLELQELYSLREFVADLITEEEERQAKCKAGKGDSR